MGEFRYGLIIGILLAAVVGLGLVVVLDNDQTDTPKTDLSTPSKIPKETESRSLQPKPAVSPKPVAAEPPANDWAFRTPTGNIVCAVAQEGASCGIREFDYPVPAKPDSCGLAGWGQFLSVNQSGPGQIACSDGVPADPMSPVLDYGASVRSGAFTCSSAVTGVSCLNTRTGHGFDLSKEKFTTY